MESEPSSKAFYSELDREAETLPRSGGWWLRDSRGEAARRQHREQRWRTPIHMSSLSSHQTKIKLCRELLTMRYEMVDWCCVLTHVWLTKN
ncbi:hypothetical protein E2C01_014591 [Portunus trituberculatus]|uniref:Uncharacterized protein n=1 Tax=Portunus trituberculatus TaxID=210409 RepID=A0A5B7DJ97_PORTR|nr:hypothetical protein [Portunus trituberculatus]